MLSHRISFRPRPGSYLALLMLAVALTCEPVGAAAQGLSAELLRAQPAFSAPTLSPDGTRFAIVADTGSGQHSLLVFQISGANVTPLLKTAVPGLVDVTRYDWVSSSVVLMWINAGADLLPVWAMLDIDRRHVVQMKRLFASLVHVNWTDPDHVLIENLCGGNEVCLYSWDIRTNQGQQYATPLPFAAAPQFTVRDSNNVYALIRHGNDTSWLRWDTSKHVWQPSASPGGEFDVPASAGNSDDGFAQAASRYRALLAQHIQATPVRTSGTRRAVGVTTPPPGPAFMALHPALDEAADLAQQRFAGKRVYWTSVSDDLQHAVLTVQGIGEPPDYYLWSADGQRIVKLAQSRPGIDPKLLGKTRLESDWLPDNAVAVISPARNQAASRVLLLPFIADSARARQFLLDYEPTAQALAQQGVATIRVPVPSPDAELNGSEWRKSAAQRLSSVADRALQTGLAQPGTLCVGGSFEAGYAALAAAAQTGDKFACVIMIDAPLRADALDHPLRLSSLAGRVTMNWTFPAPITQSWTWIRQGAGSGVDSGDPIAWIPALRSRIFLAYIMSGDDFGSGLRLQTGDFAAAMKRAGKPLTMYFPSENFANEPKWLAAMDTAILGFVQQ